jgi:hypothetical protein
LLRCALAALFFTFAVTADVLVKAVVDDQGHDANNPVVWIEHKCAGHFGKTTQNHALPQTMIAFAFNQGSQSAQEIPFTPEMMVSSESSRPESPGTRRTNLRC